MQNRIMRERWPWNRLHSCTACAMIRAPHGTRDSRGERSRRRSSCRYICRPACLWSAAHTAGSFSRSSPALPSERTTGAVSTGAGASTSASSAGARHRGDAVPASGARFDRATDGIGHALGQRRGRDAQGGSTTPRPRSWRCPSTPGTRRSQAHENGEGFRKYSWSERQRGRVGLALQSNVLVVRGAHRSAFGVEN